MKQTLENLVDLQAIDDALRDLRESKVRLAAITAENKEGLLAFDKMLAAVADRIQETRNFCREKEEEIHDAETHIGRSRSRMNAIQSQKELTALNKEIETARRATQSRTEELSKLQEQLRGVEADHERRTKEREALAQEMASVEAHLSEELAKKGASLDVLQTRRKEIQGRLPRELFSRYERVSKGRNGLAVLAISEATCAGCNMAVPPQVFIRLIRNETLETCANCSRMLVYKPAGGTDSLSE